MRNLKLSPSLLDAYRLYLSMDWQTDGKLQSSIRREFRGNAATDLGHGLHNMFENCATTSKGELVGVAESGTVYQFGESFREHVQAYADLKPIHELWSTKEIEYGGRTIRINMRCDGLKGLDLLEIKSTSQINYEKFYESVQWKAYMWSFGSHSVTYMVYAPAKPDRETGVIELRDYAYYTIPRPKDFNATVRNEILPLIAGLIDYCENNNLMDYITQETKNENHEQPRN